MGMFMQEHDVYVGTMLDELNLRFAPSHSAKELHGGISEMAELQKEFGIFKEGRSFGMSARTLHLGGSLNHEVRNRFQLYLKHLRREKSNVKGENGDAAIVKALLANFAAKKPLPVYFDYHDMREDGKAGVIVHGKGKPLSYMNTEYLWISLPMQPRETPKPKKAAAKKKK